MGAPNGTHGRWGDGQALDNNKGGKGVRRAARCARMVPRRWRQESRLRRGPACSSRGLSGALRPAGCSGRGGAAGARGARGPPLGLAPLLGRPGRLRGAGAWPGTHPQPPLPGPVARAFSLADGRVSKVSSSRSPAAPPGPGKGSGAGGEQQPVLGLLRARRPAPPGILRADSRPDANPSRCGRQATHLGVHAAVNSGESERARGREREGKKYPQLN